MDPERLPDPDVVRGRASGEDGVIPSGSEESRGTVDGRANEPRFLVPRNDTRARDDTFRRNDTGSDYRSAINETAAPRGIMRRGFLGAVAASIAALAIVGLLWLAAREAPSAGRDPNLTPATLLATRAPQPTPTPDAPVPTLTPVSIS